MRNEWMGPTKKITRTEPRRGNLVVVHADTGGNASRMGRVRDEEREHVCTRESSRACQGRCRREIEPSHLGVYCLHPAILRVRNSVVGNSPPPMSCTGMRSIFAFAAFSLKIRITEAERTHTSMNHPWFNKLRLSPEVTILHRMISITTRLETRICGPGIFSFATHASPLAAWIF